MFRPQYQQTILCGDKYALQLMRHTDRSVEIHHSGRPFQRVRRAHQGGELGGICRILFQPEHVFRKDNALVFNLEPEKLRHGKSAQVIRIFCTHVRLPFSVSKRNLSSRQPTLLFCQVRMPWKKAISVLATVAGIPFSSLGLNHWMPWTSSTGKTKR